MSNLLNYRGYYASVRYSEEDLLLVGKVIGIRDSITFHGENIAEINFHFKDSIDNYLEVCKAEGLEPNVTDIGNAENIEEAIMSYVTT